MSPFAFFVGSGRSGTTLYRNIFDSHSELAMTHEAHFVVPIVRNRRRYEGDGFDVARFVDDLYRNPNFRRQGLDRVDVEAALAAAPPEDTAAAVRTVFSTYAARHGKRRYGDKTPGYVTGIGLLADVFPESRFVHIIHDGRDVALGYLDRDEWGPSTLADAAFYWASRVRRGQASGRQLGADPVHRVPLRGSGGRPRGRHPQAVRVPRPRVRGRHDALPRARRRVHRRHP